MMRTSAKGLAEIVGHEGIVLAPYLDSVGVWTVGVGHTAAAGPPNPKEMRDRGEELSLESAMALFREDIKKYEDRVNDAVEVEVAQHEFDALVSFDYNTGGIHRARLTEKLNAGDREGAALAFSGWHRPPEIIPRRDSEQLLFRTGTYSHRGQATLYPVRANGHPNFGKGQRVDALAAVAASGGHTGEEAEPGTQTPETGEGRPWGLAAAVIGGLVVSAGLLGALFKKLDTRWQLIAAGVLIGGVALAAWLL